MTTAALVLLGFAAVAAVANWVSRIRDDHRLEMLTKPTATLLLLGVALTLSPAVPAQQVWVAAGLALSLAGDVLLLPQVERFIGGIVAFLLAHLAFVGGFAAAGIDLTTAAVAAVAVAVLALPVAWRLLGALRQSEERGLVGPVVVYLVVIAAMVAAAAGTGSRMALAGAAIFLLSDTILAWNRFVRPLPFGRPAVMITYHLGLTGIVLALV